MNKIKKIAGLGALAVAVSGAVGAEIIGLDLALPVNDQDFARIHRAHLEHHVVVFRDQRITPQQQIDFSRRLAFCRSMCSSSFC